MSKSMTASMCYLWDPNRILLSGKVSRLTVLEEGWYRRALDWSWIDDGLSADPVEFADRISKPKEQCSVEIARKLIDTFFVPHPKNPEKVVNETQEEKRKKLQAKLRKLSKAGKASADKRKEKKGIPVQQMSNKCSTNDEQMDGNVIKGNVIKSNKEERGKNDPPASAFGKPRENKSNHPALVAVRTLTGHQPDPATWDALIAVLGLEPDVLRLTECFSAWVLKGYKKSNYAWITEWYVDGIEGKRNEEQHFPTVEEKIRQDAERQASWVPTSPPVSGLQTT